MFEGLEDLVIALTAITIFMGDGGDIDLQALAFDQHEEAAGQFVGGFNGECASRAGQLVSLRIELKWSMHGRVLPDRPDIV